MRKKANIGLLVILLLVIWPGSIFAINGFERAYEIDIPEATLNNGGVGNMISGVDVDGDGLTEIYLVNDNWNDGATETIARIYKLELTGSTWTVVWSAVAPVAYQNTWPVLALDDLDADGKTEIIWGPVNSTGTESNPYRIVVYENVAAGSDDFGVEQTDGSFLPNSKWTITTVDDENIRPMDMQIADLDSDGTKELVMADRKGNDSGMYFLVASVDDIPNTGDGSETWTLETSGLDHTLSSAPENKWDVAVIGNNAYFWSETEISKLSWSGSAYVYTALSPLAGGSFNQSSQVVDLDGDGTMEIIGAIYDWGDDNKKGVYLLQEDADTLKATELVNMSSFWAGVSRGAWGGANGDIDQDGNLDFVFGSRGGNVNANIFRLAYLGGNISSPSSYSLTVIDSGIVDGGIWSVLNIANVDDDDELEVLYTSSASVGDLFAYSYPIVVLDYGPGSSVGIDKDDFITQPTQFVLHQNYPNPFNPVTTISYRLSNATNVNLVIYDMLGREVRTIVNEFQNSGDQRVVWNATDRNGIKVSSGMYIYVLMTENFSQSRKMLLLK